MPFPTLYDREFFPRAIITFHTRHSFTVHDIKGQLLNLTSHVFRLCVLPKGDYSISTPDVVLSCVLSKDNDNMPFLTSSDSV